ncbi:TIGR04282 family arsenosugar biosynthesis glycosyltransferase [Candidatus Desantisbacteria bacterium]|nr:TIGR04282 family arsenosugar biosynthesis glycosyltransferase [Candidatus Desantisbacteria bacterium]
MNDCCVLLFVKYPENGKIKTRLSSGFKKIDKVELYKNFVMDILSTINKLKIKLYICFYPGNAKKKFIDWMGGKYLYMPQNGLDLGGRMKNCFIKAFSLKFKRVIVIGSDLPDLPGKFIKNAFLFLNNHDVVIGPASDGGYYLLGFNSNTFVPDARNKYSGINHLNTYSYLSKYIFGFHNLQEYIK